MADMTLGEIIGNNIRLRRKLMGLSQEALADRVDVQSQNSGHLWESGKYCPSAFFLCQLADVFECSVDELLGRE